MKYMINKKYLLLLSIFIQFYILTIYNPAKAFIPSTYTPNKKTLINASNGIKVTAAQLIKFGQYKEAIGLTKLAISLNPNDVSLWILRASAELNNKQLKDSLNSINHAITVNSNSSTVWFTKASIEMQMGNPKPAIKSMKKSIEINKKNANSYFLLGNAQLMTQDFNSALNTFTKAIKLNPQFWQAINNQGLIYYELGYPKKAIKSWRKVLKITSDAEPKLALAIALYSINPNNEESIKLAKEALEHKPNYYSSKHQEDQLWGPKLQNAGKKLLNNPQLESVVQTASANATFTN